MTRAELVQAVHEKLPGQSKQVAGEIVETVLESIKLMLEAGEDVKISGFGKFQVREKRARKGRNPQTGEEITISARRVISFKPSPVLKMAVNSQS